MAGIYIHIPFCNSKCAYCNFYSVANLKQKEDYLKALSRELKYRIDYLGGDPIETIYFGGGTPSLLQAEEIKIILQQIEDHFQVQPHPEITLEANPDTLSEAYLHEIRAIGINRLSIGIQSFFDEDLKYLSRKHDSSHAEACLKMAIECGFDNLSIDLIYGIPTLSDARWRDNLERFFATGIQHLSAYALTLEKGSILEHQIKSGKLSAPNEDIAVQHYHILTRMAAEHGFQHYEISNFAQDGHFSRHNKSYWNDVKYLGLGAAAHSFDGQTRQWNVSNIERFIATAGYSNDAFEKETLSLSERYDEYVITALRTMWGIDLSHIEQRFGKKFSDYCQWEAGKHLYSGMLKQKDNILYLDDESMLFADAIAVDLLWG